MLIQGRSLSPRLSDSLTTCAATTNAMDTDMGYPDPTDHQVIPELGDYRGPFQTLWGRQCGGANYYLTDHGLDRGIGSNQDGWPTRQLLASGEFGPGLTGARRHTLLVPLSWSFLDHSLHMILPTGTSIFSPSPSLDCQACQIDNQEKALLQIGMMTLQSTSNDHAAPIQPRSELPSLTHSALFLRGTQLFFMQATPPYTGRLNSAFHSYSLFSPQPVGQ